MTREYKGFTAHKFNGYDERAKACFVGWEARNDAGLYASTRNPSNVEAAWATLQAMIDAMLPGLTNSEKTPNPTKEQL